MPTRFFKNTLSLILILWLVCLSVALGFETQDFYATKDLPKMYQDQFVVPIDKEWLRIIIRANEPGGKPDLELITPSGDQITGSTTNVTYEYGDDWLITEVASPAAGMWTMKLDPIKTPRSGGTFHYTVVFSK